LAIIPSGSAGKQQKALVRSVPASRFQEWLNREICFTKASLFRQPRIVRKSLGACWLLLIVLSYVHAQDQESKLVDRLLRPDMTLRNNAQNKQFIADGASINKKATVGTFYVQKKPNSKSFAGTRDFSARQFNSHSFHSMRSAFLTASDRKFSSGLCNSHGARPP